MVVERLCYLKGTFKGCMHLRSRTLCVDQQASERSTQLHLGSRFSKRAGGDACERSLDTSAAFMHQRKSHPEHDAGRRQRDTQGCVSFCSQGPIERGTQIVELPPALGDSLNCWRDRQFSVRATEEIAEVLGMTPANPVIFLGLGEFHARESTRRVQ